MIIINESGLYALVFGSKLDNAKRFKHWVTCIVIVSELKAPNDFKCIWEREVSRSIKKDKSKATEKLFIYKGE